MIKISTMIRAFLWASAGIALSGAYAKADNFDFSFTGPLGTAVTGEIYGLTNTGVQQAATEVQIFTFPNALNPFDPNLIATTWAALAANEFTESGGSITSADFVAGDGDFQGACIPFGPCEWEMKIVGSGDNYFVGISFDLIDDFTDDITFTPAAVPEPTALVLLSTALLLVALVARKRIALGR